MLRLFAGFNFFAWTKICPSEYTWRGFSDSITLAVPIGSKNRLNFVKHL